MSQTTAAPPSSTEPHGPRGGQIYALMARVLADVQPVGKDHQAPPEAGGYAYRSIDDVYAVLHEALARHGVICTPEVIQRETNYVKGKDGRTRVHHVLTIRYTWSAPDGSSIATTTVGEAMDSGDKGANKAMTAAYKYAAFQTFAIPVAGVALDSEAEHHEIAELPAKRPPLTDGTGRPVEWPTPEPAHKEADLSKLKEVYRRAYPQVRGFRREHVENWLAWFGQRDGREYQRLEEMPQENIDAICRRVEEVIAAGAVPPIDEGE